jgi:hypothetical protein
MSEFENDLKTNGDSTPGSESSAADASSINDKGKMVLNHLIDGEREQIEEIRKHLSEAEVVHNMNDMTILRFLRGRKHDVERAFRLIIRHLEWRKEKNVDNITADACPIEISKRKAIVSGSDSAGRPAIFTLARRYLLFRPNSIPILFRTIIIYFYFHFSQGTINTIAI